MPRTHAEGDGASRTPGVPDAGGALVAALVAERCAGCRTETFPPIGRCPACGSSAVAPVRIAGPGRIYSYTVNHQRWLPALEVPSVVVLVEFPDHPGVRVVGELAGHDPSDIAVGADVELGFATGPAGDVIPRFSPVGSGRRTCGVVDRPDDRAQDR